LDFSDDFVEEAPLEAGRAGEAEACASDLRALRSEPNPSRVHPANNRTKTAAKARTRTKLLLELSELLADNARPFPITLFLRCNPIILERVETTHEFSLGAGETARC
jgi:hypothetical protein